MRAAALSVLALPLLLSNCGSKADLIIGELAPIISDAGTAGSAGSGVGAESGVGGLITGGTVGAAGGSDVGGSSEGGSGAVAGTSGAGGDSGLDCVNSEEPPLDSLIHRYSFDGLDTDTDIIDSISAQDGTLEGGAILDGAGVAVLEGSPTRQHIDLPDNLVSPLTDVTIVTWITWTGGAGYQRVFDFGIGNAGETQGDSGTSYLAVMPTTGFDNGASPGLGAEVKAAGHDTLHLASTADIDDTFVQVALVFRSGISAELYLDGQLLDSLPTTISLSDIDDRNNWLGQSQWSKDHNFQGTYQEVRIYNAALNACQLDTILKRGYPTP